MDFLATPARRRLLFAALYFSEGAPIGFIWWALPARLKRSGLDVAEVTALTAALVLPWTFKFVWAPAVDVLRSRRWGYRNWIVAAQLVMGAALLPLMWLDVDEDLRPLAVCLFLHAFAAATQDVAIDALAVRTVPADERGRINGWMQAGMLVGRSLLGGGVLLVWSALGDGAVLALLLTAVWSSMLLLAGTREPEEDDSAAGRETALRRFVAHLATAAGRRSTWLGLAFAGTVGAAFEGVGAVAQPLLVDLGVSEQRIGAFYFLPVVSLTALGALAGGQLSDRLGRKSSIVLAAAIVVVCVVALAWIVRPPSAAADSSVLAGLGAMSLGVGLLTSASYALLMDLTDPALGATEFSAFMGATNGCEAWAGFVAGRLAREAGYSIAFASLACVSVLALALLPCLRRAPNLSAPHADRSGETSVADPRDP